MKSINNTNRTYVTRNFSNFDAEENITSIDEGAFDFLKGKARLYGDVKKAATTAGTIFADAASGNPDLKGAADAAKSEIDKITNALGDDPKSPERSEYRKFLDDIEKAKEDFEIKKLAVLSKIAKYSDVTKIIKEASEMSKVAGKNATDAKLEISKRKEEENIKLKDAIKLSKTLKKDETKGKNEEIHDVQKEFIRKFKNNPKIKDSEIYKKIKDAVETKKQGGFFGPTTEKIIKGLKAGFGMDDKTSDITQDLINKIYTEKIAEADGFRTIKGFSDFDLMNEDFDAAKFLEVVSGKTVNKEGKDLPSTKEVLDAMDKATDEIYNKNKEGIDYILGNDFEPTEEGRKSFRTIFGVKWDDFKKYDEKQKKNTIASGFKSNLIPIVKEVTKDTVDNYFKKEESK